MARILLIDDDQTILDLERLILSEDGHDVLMAKEASVALEILSLYEVDLVIVDIEMPHINGFQFVNTVKNDPKFQFLPIVFLTSRTEKEDVVRAAKIGADFYLLKPINRGIFSEKVASFLTERPPKQHPKIEFRIPYPGQAKICQNIQLISITDFGVEILIEQKLEEDQVIELSVSVFHEIPLKNPLFKVCSVKPHIGNINRAHLMFLENNVETIRRIQGWILSKSNDNKTFKVS